MDPWGKETTNSPVPSEFEDNFKPATDDKLADSAEYIAALGNNIIKITL